MHLTEAKLSAESRNDLPDKKFGLPEQRKYPLNDEAHVRKAIQFFKFCPEKDRPTLANNINKRMKELKISSNVSKKNPLSEFVKPGWVITVTEAVDELMSDDKLLLEFLEDCKNENKNQLYIIDKCTSKCSLTESATAIENMLKYNIEPDFIRKLTSHGDFSLSLNPLDVVKLTEAFDSVFESKDIYGSKIWYALDNSKEGLYLILKENNDENILYGIHVSEEKQARVLTEKFTYPEKFEVKTLDYSRLMMCDNWKTASLVEGLNIDSEGNMKFSISKKKSYMDLYAENHRILMQNVENENNEGIKTNLASAFALISMIEKDEKYKQRDGELVKARAFLINDFKTYLKKLQKAEPDFDFAEYYATKDYDKFVVNVSPNSVSGIKKIVRALLV